MAQHHGDSPIDDIPRSVLEALKTPLIGKTGLFPEGKLTPSDEGGLQFELGEREGNLIINFGQPVFWIGMTPQQSIGMAEAIIAKARVIARRKGEVLTVRF